MARIAYVEREAVQPDVQNIYDQVEKAFGMNFNILKALAHRPQILKATIGLFQALNYDSSLDPKLKELAILTTSQLNGCHY